MNAYVLFRNPVKCYTTILSTVLLQTRLSEFTLDKFTAYRNAFHDTCIMKYFI